MNNSAAKVGEIFREAGTAFNKLSEMTLMLQPTDDSPPGGKWSDAEVEMLRGCINRFAVELNKISQHIKNRTMRHLKCLLEMDSGTIEDVSCSPQHLKQQPQPAQEHTLETESQCDFNETFVNIFSQGFPEQVKDEDIDQFLHHFDRSVGNSTPLVDFMQEDRSRQQAASEFEDLQDSSYDITLQAVPSLISLLDSDVNNANYSERINPTESDMANIGTLHAELPNFGCNLGEATGASSNFQEVNYNYTGLVSTEAHFSLSQAQDTWNNVSSPATNQKMGVPIESEGNFILYTGSYGQTTSIQASDETAFTEKESQYRPHDTVSGLQTQNILCPGSFNNYSLPNNTFRSVQTPKHNLMGDYEDTHTQKIEKPCNIFYPGFFKDHSLFGNLLASNITKTMPQEKPRDNILCPGSFSSLNNDPFGSVQAPNDKLEEGGSPNMISCTNLFGNSLYSANPEPVTNFSSNLADTNEHALASNTHRTRVCKGRGRSRRRREGPVTRESADPIISLPDANTAEPNQGRMTRSRRRQAYYYEIEKQDKKRSRKKTTTRSTASSRTEAQKEKQSPT